MPRTTPQATLRRLTFIVLLQWMGATLGLPLLPLFLEHRGGSPHLIGVIVAAAFVAGLCSQFFLGRLADYYGRRLILISGLVLYGLAAMTYVLPLHAWWFMISRAVQGASAGAIEVVSLSAVAALYSEHERGAAVSRVFAAQLLGIAIGPMVGVVASVRTLGWAFFATGIVSIGAALVAVTTDLGDKEFVATPLPPLQWNNRLRGALFAAATVGLTIGVYETCWSMLLHAHHASELQIRLSWTLFCIPWVALSHLGGWIADHWNRKWAATIGLCNAATFLSIYPHCHNNNVMIFIGSFEAIGAALTSPSISSLLTQGAVDREFSRRQGLSATAQTSTLAISAITSGFLFTLNPALPFTLVSGVAFSFMLCALWCWRRVDGYVAHPTTATSA